MFKFKSPAKVLISVNNTKQKDIFLLNMFRSDFLNYINNWC